jgi:prepilin-type N-terminal cleavage/methylation domain-containing protein
MGTILDPARVHAVPVSAGSVAVKPARRGLTLIEVLIALIVLGVGILALTGSSSLVTRMLGRGKVETQAALLASRRVEMLRVAASSTTPRCTSPRFSSGGPVSDGGLRESWTVSSSGQLRHVTVIVAYLTVRGTRTAVLETTIEC